MPDEKNIDVDVVDEEKKEDFEDICFLCRRPESKAGRMFKLPNHICICDERYPYLSELYAEGF